MLTPSVTNPMHSVALTFEQLIKVDVQPQVNVGTTKQAQNATIFTPDTTSSLHHVEC